MRPHRTLGAAVVLALAGCSSPTVTVPPPKISQAAPAPQASSAMQLGIDVDFYAYPGIQVAGPARQDAAYIKSLHANAVSISFPFFSNPAGTTAGATNRTPTPAQLGTVITAAQREGLTVTLRPLLDEKALGVSSRTQWEPASLPAWFAAYQAFLLPYAELAQHDHVATFVVGVEFSKFNTAPEWNTLDAALRTVYHGALAYSSNWVTLEHPMTGNGGAGVTEMTDAYPPLPLPDDAPQAVLDGAWDLWARPIPAGTVLSELGIAAQPSAYLHPYKWGPASTALDPQIQVRWFTAACRAVTVDHLGGLYFWSLNFGQSLTASAGQSVPGSFVATPGATAIANCFASLETS